MYWDTRLKMYTADRMPGVGDTLGVFIMGRAQERPASLLDRCDANAWGPMGPMREGDQRNDTPFGTEVILHLKQVRQYEIVFALPPQGFITYVELGLDDYNRTPDTASEEWLVDDYDPPCVTRTLHEMFRLMWEWTQVTYEPFTNDEVAAVTAAGILDRLTTDHGFTTAVMDDVLAAVPPMQVARYLTGDPDARRRPPVDTIGPPPQSFLDWLQSTCDPIPEPGGG